MSLIGNHTMAELSKFTINSIEINEKIQGEGQSLLMLHGWGANIKLLQPLADKLVPFGYKIYMLDLPGFGNSVDPPEPYTIFDYANFCIQYLDHHKLDKVYLFGHSFGGRLGLILGSDYANRIQKMALSDSAGIKTEAPFHAKLKLKTYQSIRDGLYSVGAKSLADNLRESYNKRYGSTDFQQVSGVMRQTFINVVNQDLLDHAKRVKVSTILIWGDKDEDTPLSDGKKLEEAIPDSALIIHEGAGHYAYLDFPDKTARIMDALFKHD
jgi:pimeloyl-ACP methyl ester carboxylesterase